MVEPSSAPVNRVLGLEQRFQRGSRECGEGWTIFSGIREDPEYRFRKWSWTRRAQSKIKEWNADLELRGVTFG